MNAQEFYDAFQHRDKDQHRFFYGLEQNEPISSLLFYRNNPQPNSLQFDQEINENSIFFSDFPCSEIEINGPNPRYSKTIKDMVFSAAELHFFRINATEFGCSLCGHKCSYNDRISHIVSLHSKYLFELFEANCSMIDNDDDFLNGFMLKFQFDPILTAPTKVYPIAESGATICSPAICHIDKKDDNSDSGTVNPNSESKLSVRFKGAFNPVLTKFANNHKSVPLSPETSSHDDLLDDHESTKIELGVVRNDEDALNSTSSIPERLTRTQIVNLIQSGSIAGSSTQNSTEAELPTKTQPTPSTPDAQPSRPTSEIEQPTSAPSKQTPQSPKQTPAPKTQDQRKPSRNISPSPGVSMPQKIPDDIFAQLSEKDVRKPTPPKKVPKYIPYIESIPKEIRQTIISNLAKQCIRSYVTNNAARALIPVIQTQKKRYKQDMRAKKAQKAKLEEQVRKDAMRQRRDTAIDKFSSEIVVPIIRSFLRSEIEAIFEQESVAEQAIEKIEHPEEVNKAPPPIVLSGLTNRRHLNPMFLADFFSSYQFQLDENNMPKIRFRFNGIRCEVLLYFKSIRDVLRLLNQSPILIEYATVTLKVEEEDDTNHGLVSYSGQELNITSPSKYLTNFAETRGLNALVTMSPMIALENITQFSMDESDK